MSNPLGGGHLRGNLVPPIHREPIARMLSLKVGVTIHEHANSRQPTRCSLGLGTLGGHDHIDQPTIPQCIEHIFEYGGASAAVQRLS